MSAKYPGSKTIMGERGPSRIIILALRELKSSDPATWTSCGPIHLCSPKCTATKSFALSPQQQWPGHRAVGHAPVAPSHAAVLTSSLFHFMSSFGTGLKDVSVYFLL